MKPPYKVQPVAWNDKVAEYMPAGDPVTYVDLASARKAVKDVTMLTGVVPNVWEGGGERVHLFTDTEVARFGLTHVEEPTEG